MTLLEIAANLVTTVSILLAARDSIHTWWTAIVGGVLFAVLFYQTRLYADVTLQLFFIVTSLAGWLRWRGASEGGALPVSRSSRSVLVLAVAVPLYCSRGLWLTGVLYAAYWINALFGWRLWRRWRRELA